MMWRLQAWLYKVSPTLLEYWHRFTFMEWLILFLFLLTVVAV